MVKISAVCVYIMVDLFPNNNKKKGEVSKLIQTLWLHQLIRWPFRPENEPLPPLVKPESKSFSNR